MLLGSSERRSSACSRGTPWAISDRLSSTVSGMRTIREASRANRSAATGVPRCGAAMKTARPTLSIGSKRRAASTRGRSRSIRSESNPLCSTAQFHSFWSAEDTISRAMTPPMLCPTRTMFWEAAAVPCGSRWASVLLTDSRSHAWLRTIGMLVG